MSDEFDEHIRRLAELEAQRTTLPTSGSAPYEYREDGLKHFVKDNEYGEMWCGAAHQYGKPTPGETTELGEVTCLLCLHAAEEFGKEAGRHLHKTNCTVASCDDPVLNEDDACYCPCYKTPHPLHDD